MDIIVFVEGWSDRFFYDRLVNVACGAAGLKYQIRTAKEIGAQGNGKPALIALFDFFKRRRVLDGSKSQRASAFFFLDKDVDELRGSIIKSRHVAYTEHFSVENYYVIAGDLPLAAAASAGLEVDELRKWLGDLNAWRRSAAEEWKAWIELCLHATLDGASCSCHFHSPSLIHDDFCGPLDHSRYTTTLDTLKHALGLTTTKFNSRHQRVQAIVNKYYSDGQHDALFNGKWYRFFIHTAVTNYAQGRDFKKHFARAICESLLSTIPFDGKWGEVLRRPLHRLVRHIKKSR